MDSDPATLATLAAENDQLRQRIALLERELAEERQARHHMEVTCQQQFHIFMQSALAFCLVRGPDHVIEFANQTFITLTGIQDFRGRPVRAVLPELIDQGFLELLDHVYTTGQTWHGENVPARLNRSNNGTLEEAWFNISYQPTYDIHGQVDGIFSFAVDVTSQVEARRKVEQLNADLYTFQALVEHALDGIILADLDGTITYANPAAGRLNGVLPAAMPGQSMMAFVDPTYLDALQRDIQHHIQQSGHWEGQMMAQRPDGTGWVAYSSIFLLRDATGTPMAISSISRDITQQVEYEHDLIRREARFRLLAENAQDIIFRYQLGPKRGFEYISPAITRITGYTPQELVSPPDTGWRVMHPDDKPLIETFLKHPNDFPDLLDLRWVCKDGRIIWVQQQISLIRDETGTPVALEGVVRDITERKRSEERLRISEKRFRSMAENLPDVIYILDLELMHPVYLNRDSFLGYDRAELIESARSIFAAVHPDHQVAVQKFWQQTLQGIPVAPVEFRMQSKDGRWEWIQKRAAILEDQSPSQVIINLNVISERKQIEAELRISEERLRAIISNAPIILFAVDQQGIFTLSEGKGLAALERQPDELVGSSIFDLYAADALALQNIHLAMAGMEKSWERTEAGRFLETHLVPTRTFDGQIIGLIGVEADMTVRKQAEEERLNIERKLQETQRLESLGMLAGGIAHDFNNLLVAVLGNADLALMDLPADSPARPVVEQIGVAARRAADLTRQLLAYTGKGRFVVEAINLNTLIEEMIHLLRTTISTDVVLHYNLSPKLPPIEADATQIRQVIMNLVINASEAIGDRNGIITLTTDTMWVDHVYAAETRLSPDLLEGEFVYLEVSDTGCGMDATTCARIFDPFFSTKFTGRGLGLAAVQGIVRGHKGAIKVYSEPGLGSSFKLFFPSARGMSLPKPVVKSDSLWQGTGTVLLIDDDPDVRKVGERMLERLGFTVLTAEDGMEGVDLFRQQSAEIVGILLDMTMPNLSGEVVFRMLRQVQPDINVVLMSGYNEQTVIGRFAGKGLAGFLQKPFTPDQLRSAIQRAFKP